MRITIDSASDVSADEQPSPVVVVRKAPPPRTDLPNFASTSSTPAPSRKGILRKTSSYNSAATPTPRRVQRFHHETDHQTPSPQLQDPETTPGRRGANGATQLPFQQHHRRRSTTPAFELVGAVPSSSRSPITSRTDASSPAAQRATPQRPSGSLPPWMRPSFNRAPRSALAGFDTDSSDEKGAGLSSSDDQEEGRLTQSDSDDSNDSDSAASSSPHTSPYDGDGLTDSDDEDWRDRQGAASKTVRTSKSRSRSGTHRADASAVKLASIAGDDWEEWNRASSRLAWQRARSSHRDASTSASGAATTQRSAPSKTASSGADVDEVQALLSSLNMRRDQEDAQIKQAFEARNADLWSGIDACILAAENEARKLAAAEAARLEAARKTQEEAERKAAQQRQAELDRIEAEKKAAQAEAERRKQEAEATAAKQKQDEAEQAKARAMGGTGDDIRKAALAEYDEWMAKIRHIKTSVLPSIASNPELRKQCFAAKRQITPKIGQLTNSRAEIVRITQAIAGVLDAAKQATASGGGDVYTWILNHLSKCLIRQAEQEVAAKQDTAYPLARVAVWLVLLGHVELADVLMARLCKKCPWIVPVWPARTKDMDEAAYRKVMGYKADETTENYSNRMNGIAAFYFGMLQTVPTPPPGQSSIQLERVPLHLRSTSLWRWSVRALTPSTAAPVAFLDHPMCPSVWSVFIEIAGTYALKLYGKQMQKLFTLLLSQGLQAKRAGWLKHATDKPYVKAATIRLELLLMDWQASPGKAVIQNATKGVEMEP
ncbi:hypothetical protein PaG_03154 [Moesziomyces aphidis]|uniref:mRNA export factor GLE1 n=1 Tax=Moesziomyces aphidis TaxID=84754 RepID=W3VP09_MOEAP|nr:hypothetical protein PaG_03154 [Moesziomyces aphidis]